MSGLWKLIFEGPDKPPPPPNAATTASQQGAANLQTAVGQTWLNTPDQVGPTGSTKYTQTGTYTQTMPDGTQVQVPRLTQTTTLGPAEQAQKNAQDAIKQSMLGLGQSQAGRLGDVLGKPLDFSQLQPGGTLPTSGPQFNNITGGPTLSKLSNAGMPIQSKLNLNEVNPNVNLTEASTRFANVGGPDRSVGPQDWSADRLRVEQGIRARAAPQLAQQREELASSLEAQGFRRGTTAFNNAMDERNRALNDFELATQQAGGAEQSRLAGLSFQQFDAENRAQQQAYEQAIRTGDFARASIAQNNLARLNEFGANLQGTTANNAARTTEAQYGLAAQGQRFGQLAQTLGFNNNAAQQTWQNANQRTQYGNDLAQRGFGNATNLAQLRDQQQQYEIQKMLLPRQTALNEVASITSGNPVASPTFQQYNAGRISDTPLSQNTYATAALQNQAYGQQLQQQQAALGALFGLAGKAATFGMS
jgi:hypothetical protein